ncbi:MAG TPA: 3-deoxy-manno-octulosonate cytidylyltransferase, partial [Thermoanaerobaculia bacterium]|nr:3-deoxy-manno-octulosonate cytidylyltransferase [Thermoanaerobaculia bacterium]
DPEVVSLLARHLADNPQDPLVTLAAEARPDELDNPNAVKVVLGLTGQALYFSRSRIPYPRNAGGFQPLKHIGIYGYQRDALLRLAELAPTPLERSESLEQLRALENGIPMRVLRVGEAAPGVDTQEDLERVERLLRGSAAHDL